MSRRSFLDNRSFLDKRFASRKAYSLFGLSNESYISTYNNNNDNYNDNEYDAPLVTKIKAWWNYLPVFLSKVYQMGLSDPRQFIFAAKSGLAFAIVSILIFIKEPFIFITQFSIWAVLTVVLVFEFSVGATLSKGFNIVLGTCSAGVLALGVAQLSMLAGSMLAGGFWEEIVIVFGVFVGGAISAFVKLYPSMRPFEYGFRIFTLTYCVVLVSGTSHIDQDVVSRLLLIGVGDCVCFAVTICVYPIWAGEDLHKLVVKNFRGVATSLEGCVNNYLNHFAYERIPSKILVFQASDDPLYSGYRSAVESASVEEALLGFAVWEPPHGRYKMLRYPWSYYVKVSGALRHCALMVMAMHGCILAEIQASAELRNMFRNEIYKVGTEGARVLRELGSKVEKMERLSPDIDLLDKVHEVAEELQMKIDQESHHLVNSEKWAPRREPIEFKDPDIVQETKLDEIKPNVVKSLSEANLLTKLNPKPHLPTKKTRFARNMSYNPNMMMHWRSSAEVLKNQMQWPTRVSMHGDTIVNVREVKTYESASALSLATFTSLLMEFVARLQNLVNAFDELSKIAKFSEPVNPLEAKENVGIWTRILKCIIG